MKQTLKLTGGDTEGRAVAAGHSIGGTTMDLAAFTSPKNICDSITIKNGTVIQVCHGTTWEKVDWLLKQIVTKVLIPTVREEQKHITGTLKITLERKNIFVIEEIDTGGENRSKYACDYEYCSGFFYCIAN